ncbi:MAG: methionine--tRNA ligase [Deltaproteobacteria bacterium]|nr:MAG: methionine--tRNA ligase [Deltaproteobacteria bacterium]
MRPDDTYYVTTPIYYVNDKPHLGHAYTTIAADVVARWHRLRGQRVHFLTGVDEHGQKVLEAATRRGISPQQHVDEMVEPYKALWERLGIEYDDFIRTTEPRHERVVQAVLQRLKDQGDLYLDAYEGWYSTAAERFWTEKDLVDGKCPDTGQPVEWVQEENWFFRMSKYADQLRDWIADHPDFIRPESRRNEVLGYLRKEVGDLCVTRPVSRMSWGVPLPWDDRFVTYVWFDALLNYISALGYTPDGEPAADFRDFWPADHHLIGKDILTTHAVYWSTMLFALGERPARQLYAHGWWTVEGRKMSKSLGNVVDPHLLIDEYGADVFRYFVLREIPFGYDGDFSHQALMERFNADLANDLGNLLHRSVSMSARWLGGEVGALDAPTEADVALQELADRAVATYAAELEALQFHKAFEALWELVRAGNKYIDTEQPWALNRQGDEERLAGVLRRCLEIVRVAATLLQPVMPQKSHELARQLGIVLDDDEHLSLEGVARLDGLEAGTPLAPARPVFPRMQELPPRIRALLAETLGTQADPPSRSEPDAGGGAAESASSPTPNPETPVAEEQTPLISIDDFAKVQLRTGRILEARKHPDADRLLVFKVDVGEEQPRTIVAGIASRYEPELLVGQQVVVVTNLKPARLRGIESQGMILAAGGKQVRGLVGVSEPLPPGTIVR